VAAAACAVGGAGGGGRMARGYLWPCVAGADAVKGGRVPRRGRKRRRRSSLDDRADEPRAVITPGTFVRRRRRRARWPRWARRRACGARIRVS